MDKTVSTMIKVLDKLFVLVSKRFSKVLMKILGNMKCTMNWVSISEYFFHCSINCWIRICQYYSWLNTCSLKNLTEQPKMGSLAFIYKQTLRKYNIFHVSIKAHKE